MIYRSSEWFMDSGGLDSQIEKKHTLILRQKNSNKWVPVFTFPNDKAYSSMVAENK